MDKNEVELRGKAIMKALGSGEPSSSLLKILTELKTGFQPTEEVLRSTRIGVTVNRLRSHKDKSVGILANELITKWKKEVTGKKKGESGAGTPKAANGTASPAPSASPAPTKAKKHNIAPEKRSHKTDNVNWQVTGNDTRDNCVRLMYDGLAHMTDELPEDVIDVAQAVEKAAYSEFRDTNDQYKNKIRSLFQNLKNRSNPGLRKRVLSGDIKPARFVTMSHDELKSAERRAEDKRLQEENMNQAMVAQVEKSISTSLTCGKCKQKKVSYSQAQTRSADEPMTTFCECMNCGNRWKFS